MSSYKLRIRRGQKCDYLKVYSRAEADRMIARIESEYMTKLRLALENDYSADLMPVKPHVSILNVPVSR